jgi:hypothetical protein
MNIMTWQDTRGTWYAKEWRPLGEPVAPKVGPYGTEAQAQARVRPLKQKGKS